MTYDGPTTEVSKKVKSWARKWNVIIQQNLNRHPVSLLISHYHSNKGWLMHR